MRSFAWALGGVLACVTGAAAGVFFGSQVLGTNFQSGELAPISNALKASYDKAVTASHSIRRALASAMSRAKPEGDHGRIAQADVALRVSSTDRERPSTKAASPLLTTYQIKNQPLRIVPENGVSGHHPRQVVITGLTAPDVRAAVARDIERALQRAGCRIGRTDGSWDRSSRAAMGRFLANVNATLPTRDPDIILLTLVRGYHGTTCGAGCGSRANDQCTPRLDATGPSNDARPQQAAAVPEADQYIGHGKREPARARTRWVAVPQQPKRTSVPPKTSAQAAANPPSPAAATPTTSEPSQPGRMALGVPRPQRVQRLKPPAVPAPVAKRTATAAPANLPAPYEPGAPRLIPDQKPVPVAATPQQAASPQHRTRRRNAGWRSRAFQVEN